MITGAIRSAPGRWTLADVKRVCRTRRRLRAFLRRWPDTRDVAAQHLGAKSARDVVATLGAYLDRYGSLLACWDRADASFSLRDFLAADGVLVLALEDGVAEAVKPLYSHMARRLSDLLLASDDPTQQTFFLFNE